MPGRTVRPVKDETASECIVRVLLVEDDLQLGESLETALRLEHYAVYWLRSGDA